MFGLRTTLGRYGITIGLTDTDEVLGNLSGGIQRGATYEGLTTLTVQLDTLKAFGWAGGTFNVSGLQIRGRNLSQYDLDNLQTASGIEADDTTRLWEIWYDQAFLDNRADVKIGQQSLDQEFITSLGSSLFINTMMGWPMVPSADLYAGGPAYPLFSLGVRLRVQPGGGFTLLGGVFQDNPPGGPFDNDLQLRGTTLWGGNFNLRTGALFIAEVQYALNQPILARWRVPASNRDFLAPISWASGTTRHRFPALASTTPACRSPIRAARRTGHVTAQLEHLWSDGPGRLAAGPASTARDRHVRPRDGCAR